MSNEEIKTTTEVLVKGYADKAERLAVLERAIEKCNNDVLQRGIDVAGILGKIFDNNLYSLDGAKSIGEYAEKRFGMKKAQCSALCKAARLFMSETETDSNSFVVMLPIKNGVAWNVTQLTELCRAAKEEKEVNGVVDTLITEGKIDSTMSAKAIREVLTALVDKENKEENSTSEEGKAKNAEKASKEKKAADELKVAIETALAEIVVHANALASFAKKNYFDEATNRIEAIAGNINEVLYRLGYDEEKHDTTDNTDSASEENEE